MFVLCYSILYLAVKLLQTLTSPLMSGKGRVYTAQLPTSMYLSRNGNVNPKVFLQWGQETAGLLRLSNFCHYGLFEINASRTIFMRNIRLTLSEKLYEITWADKPYLLTVEAFNSNTGRTSVDLTLRWRYNGDLIATLIRKMVYVCATTGKPIELPLEFTANNPDTNTTSFSLTKDVAGSPPEISITVRPSDLDFNNHVGHPVYIDYLLDSAYHNKYRHVSSDLMSESMRCIDIEYKYPVVLGRKVLVQSWDDEGDQGREVNFVMHQEAALTGKQLVCLGKVLLFGR